MKNMILILLMLFFAIGCSEEEPKQQLKIPSIYGTWQLVEAWYFDIANPNNTNWGKVSNGYKITFNKDLSYEPEIKPYDCNEISSSVFVVQNDSEINTESEKDILNFIGVAVHDNSEINILETTITCTSSDITFKSKSIYVFQDATHLILIPIEPTCPEGCARKFKKRAELSNKSNIYRE